MPEKLSLDRLKQLVSDSKIDTVLVCQIDMQGRLMGKRFHAKFFLDSAVDETHSCSYLLATDMEMETVDGYKATSWEAGYGDYIMKPDLSTLRLTPWLEGTAMVLCDVLKINVGHYCECTTPPTMYILHYGLRSEYQRLAFAPAKLKFDD